MSKLQEIIRVDGYTIGRCDEEIYVLNPHGLMAWQGKTENESDPSLGFPHRVPTSVKRCVAQMLKSLNQHNEFSDDTALQLQGNLMTTRTAWLFPGQGSQEIGMGASLKPNGNYYDSAFELAEDFSELPLRECVTRGPEETLTSTNHAQPAIIALSIAYVDFLTDQGMRPEAVAGHSLGEFAALYAAGVLSAKDTLRLAAVRGKLMSESADGTMVAVKKLGVTEVQNFVQAVGSQSLVIANLNTPQQTVVSGDVESVEQLEQALSTAGHPFVRLNVSGAWHSPLVKNAARKFKAVLDTATWCDPQIHVFLGAVGKEVATAEEIRDIMFRQITSPVYWHETIQAMIDVGMNDFLEVGAGKVLRGLMRKAVAPGVKYDIRGVDNKRFVKRLVESQGGVKS